MHSAIYPVASLHLTPTRFVADPAISRNPRPGCRHRQPPCRPGRRRCGPRSQTGDRRLLQCLPSLDGRRRIPIGLSRVQPERRPPQPRQWIGVGSGDTGPGLSLWLPVGGGPVFPGRRCHRLGGSQQLPQPRYFLVRRRTVLAGTHDRPVPVCRTVRPPWPIAPGSGCALSAVPECWQWSLAYSVLPIPSQI